MKHAENKTCFKFHNNQIQTLLLYPEMYVPIDFKFHNNQIQTKKRGYIEEDGLGLL